MFELIFGGLSIGALYALSGIGLAITFGLMRQINLAHGDLIVFSGYFSHLLMSGLGISPLATIPLVAMGMFLLGMMLQKLLFDPVLGRGVLPPLLVTFGLSIMVQNGLQLGFSANTRSLDPGYLGSASLNLGGITVGLMPLGFILLTVIVFGLLAVFLGKTRFGIALRATADDGSTARLMGIKPTRIFAVASGLSLATSALAAVFLGMRSTFTPVSGSEQLLFAFEAVVLGGLGSIWGTLAGGITLGLSQSAGAAISPVYGTLAGHLVFLIILLLRPQGLFSRRNNK